MYFQLTPTIESFFYKWGLIFDVIADSNTQSRSRFVTINGLDLKLFIKEKKEIHCQKQNKDTSFQL